MNLTIHIVYLPHTVKILSFFVRTLLASSDCAYCLVSNGCTLMEQEILRNICESEPRLSYRVIPTRAPLSHGQALTFLQAGNTQRLFCFMDSDIFATDNFLQQVAPLLESGSACFSGTPVWIAREDEVLPNDFQVVSGHHQQTSDGICLGCTYFSIYDNEALASVIQKTGVGFDSYTWDQIPRVFQLRLAREGLDRQIFDTGKLLNFLLRSMHAAELTFLSIPEIVHLGGMTFEARYAQQGTADEFRSKLNGQVRKHEFETIVRQREIHRDPVRRFFTAQLKCMAAETEPLVPPTVGNLEIDIKVQSAAADLLRVYREFGDVRQSGV